MVDGRRMAGPMRTAALAVMARYGTGRIDRTGPFCETGLSVSIRMYRDIDRTPDDFGLTGEWKERVTSAVRHGHTVFVSGGTSSGKTTLLNTLIPFIPSEKRILTVEDTRELR